MNTGSSVQIGPIPSGSIVGFWIRADGFGNPNNPVYYSIHNTSSLVKNPDGYRHAAWVKTNNVTLIGFEDLNNLGDHDYNDGKWDYNDFKTKSRRFYREIVNFWISISFFSENLPLRLFFIRMTPTSISDEITDSISF